MIRRQVLSAVLLFCILPGPVAGQAIGDQFGTSSGKPGPGAYVLEGLGALGTGVGFALLPLVVTVGVALGYGPDPGYPTKLIVCDCITEAAYAIGSSVGAGVIGHAVGWDGSTGWSYGLAMVPPVVSGGLLFLESKKSASKYRDAGIVFAIAGPPILATVGYNIVASREMYGSAPGRFLPPSLAARMVGSPETGTSICLDARLVAVRF